MSKSIHGRTISKKDPDSMAARYPADSPKHQALVAKVDERRRTIAIADKIAESPIWYRNWKWPGSDTHYPNHPDMRLVDKCYPYAKGGMLLVDEPADEAAALLSYEKQIKLRSLGFRHIVIEQHPPTTFYDALDQLGDI